MINEHRKKTNALLKKAGHKPVAYVGYRLLKKYLGYVLYFFDGDNVLLAELRCGHGRGYTRYQRYRQIDKSLRDEGIKIPQYKEAEQ